MMKASDRKRLREVEKEWLDCYLDRYNSDQIELYRQNPELESLSMGLSEYLDSQEEQVRVPTYFYYWEDEEHRRRVWILMHDPIACVLFRRLLKTEKDIIDGKRRMKRVGDGSHTPVKGQAEESLNAESSQFNPQIQPPC